MTAPPRRDSRQARRADVRADRTTQREQQRRKRIRRQQRQHRLRQLRRALFGRTAAVVVLVLAVVGGVIAWQVVRSAGAVALPRGVASVASGIPVATSPGTAVHAGAPAVDLYEDFACPICKRLESGDGATLRSLAQSGRIRLRYHLTTFVSQNFNSGYSAVAANAGYCAQQQGAFPAYHDVLFAHQPNEPTGGAAYPALSTAQLTDLGNGVGLPAAFAACVRQGTYAGLARKANDNAVSTMTSKVGQVGTPLVLINGKPDTTLSNGGAYTPALLTSALTSAGMR